MLIMLFLSVYYSWGDPVSGRVVDGATGKPLAEAQVSIYDAKRSEYITVITDAEGMYKADVPIGEVGISGSWKDILRDIFGHSNKSPLYFLKDVLFGKSQVKGYIGANGIQYFGADDKSIGIFYTTYLLVKVHKVGYKNYDGEVWSYDYKPRLLMGVWGSQAGFAKLDDILLFPLNAAQDSQAPWNYATLLLMEVDKHCVEAGQSVKVTVRFTPVPGEIPPQTPQGNFAIRCFIEGTKVKAELFDNGKEPDAMAGDLIYTGKMFLPPQMRPVEYKVLIAAFGRLHGKRWAEEGYGETQLAARNISAFPLFVVQSEAQAAAAEELLRALAAEEKKEDILPILRKAVALAPDYLPARHRLGELLYEKESFEEAIPHLQASATAPEYLSDLVTLADCLRLANRQAEALEIAKDAWKKLPQNYTEQRWRTGIVLLHLGEYKLPLAFFHRIQTQAVKAGNEELALEARDLERIAEQMPRLDSLRAKKDIKALTELAWSLYRRGFDEEAARVAEEWITLSPQSAEANNLYGLVQFRMGKYELAKDFFLKASQLAPEQYVYHFNLGEAYARLGDKERAKESWQRALNCKDISADAKKEIEEALSKL